MSTESPFIPENISSTNGWVIIPAYCEAAVVGDVVSGVVAAGFQVLVVDDGSPDETLQRATDAGSTVIRHAINLGQGAALETGMEWARRRGADWVVHFDADGQHDPADIPFLLDALSEADVVFGSRFMPGSATLGMSLSRRLLLRVARILQNIVTGVTLTDAHCGLRALSCLALQKIRLTERGMAHATEIVSQASRHKLRVREVPARVSYTDYSRSKGQSPLEAFRILGSLVFRRLF